MKDLRTGTDQYKSNRKEFDHGWLKELLKKTGIEEEKLEGTIADINKELPSTSYRRTNTASGRGKKSWRRLAAGPRLSS